MNRYVIYKFKSQVDVECLPIDGINISVGNLKKEIIKRKKLGQKQDVDLKILDFFTNNPYNDDTALIDAYKQLLVIRVPSTRPRNKTMQPAKSVKQKIHEVDDPRLKIYDLVNADMTEQDKIRIMMAQSTYDYKASNYLEVGDTERKGPVPGYYRCRKCHRPGHWVSDCTLQSKVARVKKCSGIPRNFMVQVEGPEVRGALLTAAGTYAVPTIDYQVYNKGKGGAATSLAPFTIGSAAGPSFASPADHKVTPPLAPSSAPKIVSSVISPVIAPPITSHTDESIVVTSHRPMHPRGNTWKRRRHQPYSTSRPIVLRHQIRQFVTLT